ncbi:helix-turn-helix domain-containing protein [Brucella intermedia]|uniref:helix-turn-helix domain-containing protein n=1 Tax=Brucella intermedia TaxID=94625 RepID=UPI003AB2E513
METADFEVNEPDAEQASQVHLIGQRLKTLRAEKRLTISGLAERAGISAGLISQIERGHSNPSVNTLEKLRIALGTNIWEFRDTKKSSAEPAFVRRSDERPKVVVGTKGFSKELLSPTNDHSMRFMILKIPSGAQSSETLNGPGDKGGYVLKGIIHLTVGGETVAMSPGDSCQFDSTVPHHLENHGEEDAELLWIISIREAHL